MASWRVTVHATFLLSKLVLPGDDRARLGPDRQRHLGVGDRARALRLTRATIVGDTAYGAQKAAIERFTQGLAEEVYPAGVGVAAIAPSLIVPTPGALANAQITGPEDPRAEDPAYMPEAVRRAGDRASSTAWPGGWSTASSCSSRRGC